MTTSHNIYIPVHCQLALLYDQIINILRRSSAVKLENMTQLTEAAYISLQIKLSGEQHIFENVIYLIRNILVFFMIFKVNKLTLTFNVQHVTRGSYHT